MATDHKNRKWEIVPYNPKWKDDFLREAKLLQTVFRGNTFSIEHVGSTAVPGLAGKPTIDILIVVNDITTADLLNSKIESLGYEAMGESVMPGGTRLFAKELHGARLFNLHVFQKDHPHIKEMLDLKKYLIAHPEIAREYSQLKFNLFKKYAGDYAAYRRHKDKWMNKLKGKV